MTRLIDENGIINVGEFHRLWNKDRIRFPSVAWLCGRCLGYLPFEGAACTRCAGLGIPPTNEDR